MKIFISYSLEDKKDADILRGLLDRVGFECFLAHRDIRKGDPWREAIVKELKASNVFIPILSDHGLSSPWVHQECGMAHLLRTNKKQLLIVPLTINNNTPPGCLSIYQSMKVNLKFFGFGGPDLSYAVAKSLALEIAKQTSCTESIKTTAIKNLGHASVGDVEYILGFLVDSKGLRPDDFQSLVVQANANHAIAYSDIAMNYMYQFLESHWLEIGKHPHWVAAWNRLLKKHRDYREEQRRRQEEVLRKITEAQERATVGTRKIADS